MEDIPLAKKFVKFLCNRDSPSTSITVPKTEHRYRFYKNIPYLIKFDLDIEFFDKHLDFDEVNPNPKEDTVSFESKTETDASDIVDSVDSDSVPEKKEDSVPEKKTYDKKKLQEMRKSDLRELLEKLSPGKTCPVRKNNIINLILEVQ